MKNYICRSTLALGTILVVANVKADVTLGLNNPNSGGINSAYCSYSGLSAYVQGVHDITGQQWIGIYGFTVVGTPSPNVTSPFYSICFSPGGDLTTGNYAYNAQPIGSAMQINPGNWATYGVQNAAFLFSQFEPAIVHTPYSASGDQPTLVGSTAEQGTALALAIYSALWNSIGLAPGTVGANVVGSGFYIDGFGDSNIAEDYAKILDDLKYYSPTTAATILVPNNQNAAGPSGQEFILLTGQVTGSPVPEPSTVIAGLLLLLPFGAGVARIVRRKRA